MDRPVHGNRGVMAQGRGEGGSPPRQRSGPAWRGPGTTAGAARGAAARACWSVGAQACGSAGASPPPLGAQVGSLRAEARPTPRPVRRTGTVAGQASFVPMQRRVAQAQRPGPVLARFHGNFHRLSGAPGRECFFGYTQYHDDFTKCLPVPWMPRNPLGKTKQAVAHVPSFPILFPTGVNSLLRWFAALEPVPPE